MWLIISYSRCQTACRQKLCQQPETDNLKQKMPASDKLTFMYFFIADNIILQEYLLQRYLLQKYLHLCRRLYPDRAG